MSIRTEINQSPDGEITVVTENVPYPYRGKITISKYVYDYYEADRNVKALRKDLFHEHFWAQVESKTKSILMIMGTVLVVAPLANHILPGSPIPEALAKWGGYPLLIGILYSKQFDEWETRSRVEAFNKTFPNLKPIKFSPREYFSTLKIPFLHRRPRIS